MKPWKHLQKSGVRKCEGRAESAEARVLRTDRAVAQEGDGAGKAAPAEPSRSANLRGVVAWGFLGWDSHLPRSIVGSACFRR